MPTFVRTASIYIDSVDTPEEADAEVAHLNAHLNNHISSIVGEIILSEDSKWEEVGDANAGTTSGS